MYDVINFIFLMSTNKSISYILCNNDIIVNLYKLHFLSSHFYFQPNKRVFHLSTFSPLHPNTHEEKPNFFLFSKTCFWEYKEKTNFLYF